MAAHFTLGRVPSDAVAGHAPQVFIHATEVTSVWQVVAGYHDLIRIEQAFAARPELGRVEQLYADCVSVVVTGCAPELRLEALRTILNRCIEHRDELRWLVSPPTHTATAEPAWLKGA